MNPQFKSSLRVEAVADDLLFILSERKRLILTGRSIVLVAQAIDGARTVEEIIDVLSDRLSASEVLNAIRRLNEKGHLCTSDPTTPELERSFWELFSENGATAVKNLSDTAVSVESVAGLSSAPLARALASSGMRVVPEGALRIVLTDDYDRPELACIVRKAAEENATLLLIKPTGITPTIGPLIHPRSGACLTCLQFWIRINHPVETFISRLRDGAACRLPLSISGVSEQAVYGLAALAIVRLLATREDRLSLQDNLLAIDLTSLQTTPHRIVKRPQCSHCGDPDWMRRQADQCPVLEPVRDLRCQDGGYRTRDPVHTFETYKHLISPISGAVSYLHTMPGRYAGLRKVYVSGYLVCPQDIPRGNAFDKVCAGKGQTDEQARASALCEALERFSGVYQGDEAVLRGSRAELGDDAIDFNALQNFSDLQFANRDSINALTDDRRKQIPLPFDRYAVIDWTPAWSLTTGRKRHVPLTYCYAGAPHASGSDYGIHNPNGAAAGNCLEEAILQGLLELVERDATAIWWYNRIARPGIDLASFGDPYFESLRLHYAHIGWRLWVLDLTHDLGIPACAAIACDAADQRYAIGFGCHLDARLAVQRALTEVNQLFDPADGSPAPWDTSTLMAKDFLYPAPEMASLSASALPSVGGQDLKSDLDQCIRSFSERGLELLVVDKTRPDIGLSVVQVIVPGLRHFWPRFGPGRLYSVSHAMGWRKESLREDELNPTSLFL